MQCQPHFAGTINVIVVSVYPGDVLFEFGVADLAAAGLAPHLFVEGRGGDRHTEPGELCADRLDTPAQTIWALTVALMIGDKLGH
ncbi:hypothetical protein MKCMC460_61270 (plasmid) [Mycobacterium sp. 20KCMC460]|nr:hypothetical protein MKCMC460_61270 [Mycobacterium sp. 20KCMC460]